MCQVDEKTGRFRGTLGVNFLRQILKLNSKITFKFKFVHFVGYLNDKYFCSVEKGDSGSWQMSKEQTFATISYGIITGYKNREK